MEGGEPGVTGVWVAGSEAGVGVGEYADWVKAKGVGNGWCLDIRLGAEWRLNWRQGERSEEWCCVRRVGYPDQVEQRERCLGIGKSGEELWD